MSQFPSRQEFDDVDRWEDTRRMIRNMNDEVYPTEQPEKEFPKWLGWILFALFVYAVLKVGAADIELFKLSHPN